MRVTRATVPYFFWAATIAAAVLAALAVARALDIRTAYTDPLWVGLPAVLVIVVCVLTIVGASTRLHAAPPDEPGYRIGARHARIIQISAASVGLAAIVADFFVAARPMSSAIMIVFCLTYYFQYLGYFALVRRYG
jgi:hypothetical protein